MLSCNFCMTDYPLKWKPFLWTKIAKYKYKSKVKFDADEQDFFSMNISKYYIGHTCTKSYSLIL